MFYFDSRTVERDIQIEKLGDGKTVIRLGSQEISSDPCFDTQMLPGTVLYSSCSREAGSTFDDVTPSDHVSSIKIKPFPDTSQIVENVGFQDTLKMQDKMLNVPPQLQTVPAKRKRKKKKVGKTQLYQRAVVADHFLEGCENYITGVLYLKVNDPFLERSQFVHGLNVVSQMRNVRTVVISAYQDIMDNEGLDVWSEVMAKHISAIKMAAKRKPTTKFIVLGPRAQINDPGKENLCEAIMTQFKTGFKGIGNIFIEDIFSGKVDAEERRKEVFGVVLNCFESESMFQIQPNSEREQDVSVSSKLASSEPDVAASLELDLPASAKLVVSPENSSKSPDRFDPFTIESSS